MTHKTTRLHLAQIDMIKERHTLIHLNFQKGRHIKETSNVNVVMLQYLVTTLCYQYLTIGIRD